jgi:flagellar basal body-associated protein FliL
MVLHDSQALTFLQTRVPEVDDIIISILKRENIDNLRTRAGLELLKREIARQVNGFLNDEFLPISITKDRAPVKNTLFTGFVLN